MLNYSSELRKLSERSGSRSSGILSYHPLQERKVFLIIMWENKNCPISQIVNLLKLLFQQQ